MHKGKGVRATRPEHECICAKACAGTLKRKIAAVNARGNANACVQAQSKQTALKLKHNCCCSAHLGKYTRGRVRVNCATGTYECVCEQKQQAPPTKANSRPARTSKWRRAEVARAQANARGERGSTRDGAHERRRKELERMRKKQAQTTRDVRAQRKIAYLAGENECPKRDSAVAVQTGTSNDTI